MRDATAGYAVIDMDGILLTVNDAFAKLLGQRPEALRGTALTPHFRDRYRPLALDWLNAVKAGTEVKLRQLTGFLHRDGSTKMVDLNAAIIRGEDAAPLCVVLAAWDVTDILSRSSRTKDARDMLKLALDVNRIGTWEHVPETDAFVLDDTAQALFGYRPGSYPYTRFADHLAHHGAVALDDRMIDRLRAFEPPRDDAADETLSVKVRLVRRLDGSEFWVRIGQRRIAHPFLPGEQKVIGTVQDIDSEVQAFLELVDTQRALRRNTEIIEAATDAIGVGIFRVVPASNECWFSASWFTALGYAPDELPHKLSTFSKLLHADDADAVLAKSQDALASGRSRFDADFRLRRKDGTYAWIGAAGRMIRDDEAEGGIVVVGAQFDISERVEARQRVEAAAELASSTSARLKNLTENVPGAIYEFEMNSEGLFSFPYFTSDFPKLLGITRAMIEADPNTTFENIHPEDRSRVRTQILASAESLDEFKLVYRVLHPDRGLIWLRASATPVAHPDGEKVWHGSLFDVTNEMERERELEKAKQITEQQSNQDQLTTLPNRRAFDNAMMARYQDEHVKAQRHTLIRIDLDHFKFVNDTLGHAAGDAVLVHMAYILRTHIRETDLAARVGGDEFVILMAPGQTTDDAMEVVRRVHKAVREPFMHDGRHCRFDSSFGVANCATLPADPGELLSFADAALYEAKRAGRGRTMTFTPALQSKLQHVRRRAEQIQSGLERAEFIPFFQPQIDAQTGQVSGCEVLARWQHPEEGLITPDEFIPVAEQIRVVQDIDRAVFLQALDALGRLQNVGLTLPKMSFNVSIGRILDPDIIQSVRSLQTHGTKVAFELLESILLEEEGAIFEHHLDLLKECGVDIEVDDFGSGRASIIGVMRVAPNTIKIDRRLIQPLVEDHPVSGLVRAIIDIGHTLKIDVTAEGVETLEHARILTAMGCKTLQGFAFARPMPEDKLAAFLRSYRAIDLTRRVQRRA